jgi:hypothetical protein
MKTSARRNSTPRRARRGQAMVEYSFINFWLVMGLMVLFTVNFETGSGRMNVIHAFMRAYQIYYDSFYFVLSLPFP